MKAFSPVVLISAAAISSLPAIALFLPEGSTPIQHGNVTVGRRQDYIQSAENGINTNALGIDMDIWAYFGKDCSGGATDLKGKIAYGDEYNNDNVSEVSL